MQNPKITILVTGGTGYIGSHTVVKLIESGMDVVVLDNLCNSKSEVISRIEKITNFRPELAVGDIRDRNNLRELFSRFSFDAVIHFAGLKAVGESVIDPLKYYDNNVNGSVVLFEEMQRAGVKKLVFSSSATVYGIPSTVPIKESAKLSATNPYGETKLTIENILRDIHKSDPKWAIACLRYFNPVGAHFSGLIGEDPLGAPNNLLPFIGQVAKGKYEKLLVFGGDYLTPDGTGVRDYIHVEDLAMGHIAALNALQKPGKLNINLGSGKGYSVLEVIKAFEAASGKTIPFEIVERRQGDIAISYADPTLAKKILGWQTHFDLSRMCEDAWRWQTMSN